MVDITNMTVEESSGLTSQQFAQVVIAATEGSRLLWCDGVRYWLYKDSRAVVDVLLKLDQAYVYASYGPVRAAEISAILTSAYRRQGRIDEAEAQLGRTQDFMRPELVSAAQFDYLQKKSTSDNSMVLAAQGKFLEAASLCYLAEKRYGGEDEEMCRILYLGAWHLFNGRITLSKDSLQIETARLNLLAAGQNLLQVSSKQGWDEVQVRLDRIRADWLTGQKVGHTAELEQIGEQIVRENLQSPYGLLYDECVAANATVQKDKEAWRIGLAAAERVIASEDAMKQNYGPEAMLAKMELLMLFGVTASAKELGQQIQALPNYHGPAKPLAEKLSKKRSSVR